MSTLIDILAAPTAPPCRCKTKGPDSALAIRSGRPCCLHCRRNIQAVARGLCKVCHADKAVRLLYPLRQTHLLGLASANQYYKPLPLEPTDALPGTAEKIEVMRERAEAGFHIWHPHDATHEAQDREKYAS